MSTLFAFNYTEESMNVEVGGHYDADQQLWVGGSISVSNFEMEEPGGGETLIATTTARVDGKVRNDRIVDNAC